MLPRVSLHNAVSVDGRMDWIAPDLGQYYQIASRWKEDATLVGSDTILHNPFEAVPEEEEVYEVPARDPGDTRPLLVIPDSRGRVRCWAWLRRQPYWRDVMALCCQSTPESYLGYLRERQVDYIVAGGDRVDFRTALEELNSRYDVKVVRVDSGGTLNGVLLRSGLVDEVSVMIDPCLVGGVTPRSLFQAPDLTSPEGVIRARLAQMERLTGDTVWLRYEIVR